MKILFFLISLVIAAPTTWAADSRILQLIKSSEKSPLLESTASSASPIVVKNSPNERVWSSDVLQEINTQAEKIWSLQLECGGNDSSVAKRLYANGHFCNPQIKNKILELRRNIQILSLTANLTDKLDSEVIFNVHPLVTQMMLEEYAALTKAQDGWSCKYSVTNKTTKNCGFVRIAMSSLLHTGKPWAEYLHKAYDEVVSEAANSEFQAIRKFLFYRQFFNSLAIDSCDRLGFWPKISRMAFYYFDNSKPRTAGELTYFLTTTQLNTIDQCRDPNWTQDENSWQETYKAWEASVVFLSNLKK